MRILELFDIYFAVLIIIQGVVTLAVDYNNFKKRKMNKSASQSKIIGIVIIVIGVTLHILFKLFYKY